MLLPRSGKGTVCRKQAAARKPGEAPGVACTPFKRRMAAMLKGRQSQHGGGYARRRSYAFAESATVTVPTLKPVSTVGVPETDTVIVSLSAVW